MSVKHSYFTMDLQRFAGRTNNNLDGLFRAVCLKLVNYLAWLTPRDTGLARGNWQTSIDEPKMGVLDRKCAANSIGPVMAEAKGVIRPGIGIAGRTVYFVNNLPYILVLEHGSSKQAPHGMVQEAIHKILSEVQAGNVTGGAPV